MFNTKQKTYSYKTKATTTSSYNEEVETYTAAGSIKMFISLITNTNYSANDTYIAECEYVGIIDTDVLKKGDIVADNLEVRFINKEVKPYIVYLKEMENNGTSNYSR